MMKGPGPITVEPSATETVAPDRAAAQPPVEIVRFHPTLNESQLHSARPAETSETVERMLRGMELAGRKNASRTVPGRKKKE